MLHTAATRRGRALPAAVLSAVLLVTGTLAGCSSDEGASAPTSPSASADDGSTSPSPSPTVGTGRFPTYVALGDSYTAAPGVPTQDPDDGCQRSSNNYPHLVAAHFTGSALTDVSCSGADSTSLVGVQRTPDGVLHPAQFDALSNDVDLVTIGMGGNDLNLFGTLIGGCIAAARTDTEGTPCTDLGEKKLQKTIAGIRERLTAAFLGVKDRAPKAEVVAVGYPQIVPATGTCLTLLPIAAGDYPFARRVNQQLDDAVRAAAAKAKVGFADVWAATAGHDICADDPWINGAQQRPNDAIPFHPFAAEQKAAARAVIAAIGSAKG